MILTLDFETYFDKDYTLKKLTIEEYIRDPRFYVMGCGLQRDDGPPVWVSRSQLSRVFSKLDWSKIAVLAHHAHFDCAILNWIYGIKPAFILDTISMARPFFPGESTSLENLAIILEAGEKGKELANFIGVRDMSREQEQMMASYCCNDVYLTKRIYDKLVSRFPKEELKVIDQTIREYTEPILQVDLALAHQELMNQELRLQELLQSVGVADTKTLSSNDKFAQLLISLGVEPPTKISEKTGKTAWALSKKDEGFKQLIDSDDDIVAGLVQARMGAKSTIKKSRAERFAAVGSRGPMPSYSYYYGAHTGRPSGGDKMNLKNLPSSGLLRKALIAPPGYVCVMRDLSQIEARMLAYLAGQQDVIDAFREGVDPYCYAAGEIYGRKIDKKKDPKERQVGKIVVLGCLAEGTKVLTDSGWKDIPLVKSTDKVWDGIDWVSHSGLLYQGEKVCLQKFGIAMTTDHEILTERGWVEWNEVRAESFLFQSALSLASLPSSHGRESNEPSGTIFRESDVAVDGKDSSIEPISSAGEIEELYHSSKKLSKTYDIAFAGPRNRFTVMTGYGPIIVHNCGYNLGWANLQGQLRIGFLGMPPIIFDASYIDTLRVPIDAYKRSKYFMRAVEETFKPHFGYEEHLVHCAVTKHLVDSFRAANSMIVNLWEDAGAALADILAGVERPIGFNNLISTGAHGLTYMPTGMPINYYNLERLEGGRRPEYRYYKKEGRRMLPVKIYGGKMTENMVQGLSYILIKHNKLELAKEFKVAMDTYDEIVCVVPEEQAEYCQERMTEVMGRSPWWAPDLPLKSGGGYDRSYGECEK